MKIVLFGLPVEDVNSINMLCLGENQNSGIVKFDEFLEQCLRICEF